MSDTSTTCGTRVAPTRTRALPTAPHGEKVTPDTQAVASFLWGAEACELWLLETEHDTWLPPLCLQLRGLEGGRVNPEKAGAAGGAGRRPERTSW